MQFPFFYSCFIFFTVFNSSFVSFVISFAPKIAETTLPIWEGDKIFFRLLNGDRPYFSLKLVYDGDTLKQAVLDGEQIVGKT